MSCDERGAMIQVPESVLAEAADAMHAFDCGCTDYGNEPDGDEDLYYHELARAAAPSLARHAIEVSNHPDVEAS